MAERVNPNLIEQKGDLEHCGELTFLSKNSVFAAHDKTEKGRQR